MKDIIYREDAIRMVHEEFDECLVWDESGKDTADEVERVLDRVPSAERTGERELLKDGTLMLSTDLDITDVRRIILQKRGTHFCSVFYL